MNIHHLLEEIKHKISPGAENNEFEFDEEGRIEKFPFLKKIFLSLIIILVASLSFGLGQLSGVENREPIRIEYDPSISNQTASVIGAVNNLEDSVVVSSKGTKYHYLHCSGAKQISEANKIVFASAQAAESAGYTLAKNCSPR